LPHDVRVTVYLCAKCSTELTPELRRLHAVPDVPADPDRTKGEVLAPSTVPRGYYAIEPEPWGAPYAPGRDPWSHAGGSCVSAGPRNTVVIHPEDAPLLQPLPGNGNGIGCCGPSGMYGPNRACPCGTVVATLTADCLGPYELHLDPVRVFALD
jgi:hypothetical protein